MNLPERLRDIGHSKVVCGDVGDDFFDAANEIDRLRTLADDAAVLLDRLNLHDEGWNDAVTQWQARCREARGEDDPSRLRRVTLSPAPPEDPANCWRCSTPLPDFEPPMEPICDECYQIVVRYDMTRFVEARYREARQR